MIVYSSVNHIPILKLMDKTKIHDQLFKQRGHLFVTHDLSVTNFKKALTKDKSPSLSFPSFAIQHFGKVNEDNLKLGFAGDSTFGDIRLVIDGSLCVRDNHLLNEFTAFDGDICSAMIPPIRYSMSEDDLFDYIAEQIAEHPCINEIMEDLMQSISEDILEDGYIIYADFHSELVRTTAMKFLFSKLIAKDGVAELHDFDKMKTQLEANNYRTYDPRYDDLIATILESAALEKGMTIDDEYIKIGDGVTEGELIEALFEAYPVTEFGALVRQFVARGEDERVHLEDALLNTLFSKRFSSVYDIFDSKKRLINATGVTPYCSDKSNFTSAIGQLRVSLGDQNPNLLRLAFLDAFKKLTTQGELSVNEIATVFSDNGIIVGDKLLRDIERCFEYKAECLQPYFELKYDGECPMDFVSHIVVKDILKDDVEMMLKASNLNIPVVGYSGGSISEIEWGRAMATLSRDLRDIALLDKEGMPMNFVAQRSSPRTQKYQN
ncbi:hypothetical protein OTK49_01580 [Vibrio coralliirubri]|uniref:hypothetical protein n=1 Tax=Vibrio coralliirubri TaxID=1516159 RepID=UPI0022845046|nr:hypothetical protein [Vibrio coralliirubri]MCY9861216.1 hypothetical protein [Vibrio coralliirubri]